MMQAAIRLREAKESGDPDMIQAAVRINWQLWTIIQADLLEPDCPLPTDLRSNALSLATFIDKHSMQTLTNPVPERLEVLININRELASGLYQNPTEEGTQQTEAAPPAPAVPGMTDTSV
ncbi:MAG: flagellar biosynthesis regulator FlaF [Magnetovibrionaceae bacterium]